MVARLKARSNGNRLAQSPDSQKPDDTNKKLEKAIIFLSNLKIAAARENFALELRKIQNDLLEEIARNPRSYRFDPKLYRQVKYLLQKAQQHLIKLLGSPGKVKKVEFADDDSKEDDRTNSTAALSLPTLIPAAGIFERMTAIDFVRMTNIVFEAVYNQAFIELVANFFMYDQSGSSLVSTTAGQALLNTLHLSAEDGDVQSSIFRPGGNPTERALVFKWRTLFITNFVELAAFDSRRKISVNADLPGLTTVEIELLESRIQKLQGLANEMLGRLKSMGAIEGYIDHPDALNFRRTSSKHLPVGGRIVIFRRNWTPKPEDKAELANFKARSIRCLPCHTAYRNDSIPFGRALRRQQWLCRHKQTAIQSIVVDEKSDDDDDERSQPGLLDEQSDRDKRYDGHVYDFNISDLAVDSRRCPETTEAWWADMPPYFPWGETPYARLAISGRIDKDLARGKHHVSRL